MNHPALGLAEAYFRGRTVYYARNAQGVRVRPGGVVACIRGKQYELLYADQDHVSVIEAGSKDPHDALDYHPSVFNLTIESETVPFEHWRMR